MDREHSIGWEDSTGWEHSTGWAHRTGRTAQDRKRSTGWTAQHRMELGRPLLHPVGAHKPSPWSRNLLTSYEDHTR